MKIDIDQIDRPEFERVLRLELGREAIADTSEITTIIARVVSSDEIRGVLDDHDDSDFGRWAALFKRYPEVVAVRVEDWLAYEGFALDKRLNSEACLAWRASVRRSVERAAQKALPVILQ